MPDPLRAAVVGAGPAGFYATDQLLDAGFEVDLFDALPTPFGLVRVGRRARPPEAQVGHAHLREDRAAQAGLPLLRRGRARRSRLARTSCSSATTRSSTRSAPPTTTGSASPARTAPGRTRPPSSSPGTTAIRTTPGHEFDLSGGRAVVIGNGNVAIDVARMLVLDPEELAPTDTADHALEGFGALDRRARSCCSAAAARRRPRSPTPSSASSASSRAPTSICDPEQVERARREPRRRRRRSATSRCCATTPRASRPARRHRIELRFLRSPIEILGEGEDGPVTGVRVARQPDRGGDDGRLRAVPTGEEEVIECGLVLRSIGYRGRPLRRHPVRRAPRPDPQRGRPRLRRDGRAASRRVRRRLDQARPVAASSARTRRTPPTPSPRILEDREAGRARASRRSADARRDRRAGCAERAPGRVTWEGWQAIDAAERRAGEAQGRPRVKLVRLAELVEAGRLGSAVR